MGRALGLATGPCRFSCWNSGRGTEPRRPRASPLTHPPAVHTVHCNPVALFVIYAALNTSLDELVLGVVPSPSRDDVIDELLAESDVRRWFNAAPLVLRLDRNRPRHHHPTRLVDHDGSYGEETAGERRGGGGWGGGCGGGWVMWVGQGDRSQRAVR